MKPVFSVEVFPPKIEMGIEHIYGCLEGLSKLNPQFISVTYSAGKGALNNGLTEKVCKYIQDKYNINAVAHLTCTNATRQSIKEELDILSSYGISRILALRGDVTPEKPILEYQYATDLIEDINKHGDFRVYGACYPEGHQESKSFDFDIEVIKYKYDLGVKNFVSQLFFDNDDFMYMWTKAYARGVKDAKFEAGIMPITRAGQIKRMVELSGTKITKDVERIISYQDNESVKKAGIEFAINQIRNLIARGVDGIHLYTMDDAVVSTEIYNGIKDLF